MGCDRGSARVRRFSTVLTTTAVVVASLLGAAAPAQADQKGDKKRPPTPIAVAASASGSTATVTYTIDARAKDIDDRDCRVNTTRVSCGSVVASSKRSTTFVTVIPGLVGHRHTFRIRAEIDDRRDANGSADITGINNAPVAVPDSYTTGEDTPLNVAAAGILNNDVDADGDALTAVLVTGPSNGSLTLNANGSFTYTPNANFAGGDSFTYRVSDGTAQSAVATVSLTVTGGNDAPVAVADSYSTDEDTPLNVAAAGILNNDVDADGDALTVVLVTGPANGSLTLNANGSFTYAPVANFAGADSFTYRASDGTALSAVATVSLTVTAPASAQDVCVAAGLTFAGDPAGDWECYGFVADATIDALAVEFGPLCSPPGVLGTSSVGNFTPARVQCTTVPVAVDDAYDATVGTTLVVAAPGVLANDTDGAGDALTISIVNMPTKGGLTPAVDGSFSYTPNPDASGTDTFTYLASDGRAISALATVTITITAAPPPPPSDNTAPIARNDAIVVNPAPPGSGPIIFDVLANDVDPDGDSLTAVIDTPLDPSVGQLILNANGILSLTLNPAFYGSESFTYRAKDASLESFPAVVLILVNQSSSNAAPIARDDSFSTAEDITLNVPPTGFLSNDNDPEFGSLTEWVIERPLHGSLDEWSDKGFRYTPYADFSGTDTFTYVVWDPNGKYSNVATVTIIVQGLNDATVAVDDAYTAGEGVLLSVPVAQGVLANDTDVDSTVVGAAVVASPANGALVLNPDGSFDYTPTAGYTGIDTFTYRPGGTPQANVATVTITVTPTP